VKINVNGGESRRTFLKGAAMTGAVSVVSAASAIGQKNGPGGQSTPIVPNASEGKGEVAAFQSPQRAMGKTGLQVSILGVGGYHLGAVAGQPEVNNMIAKALDHGINFFDNAWEYNKGASEERLGIALKGKRDKAIVMTKVCTHGRKKDVAMQMLEESLTRLQTDHLDVWQVHEVVYYNDPEKCYAPDGVLEALAAAKQQGKVRFVGFTGHKNPSIHLAMLDGGFPFDTIQMPLNPFDYSYRSFQREVLPLAAQRGMAVFGMKSMGGSGEMISQGALTASEALTFAMSLPGVSTTISGMDSIRVLDQNLEILRNFRPLSEEQISGLRTYAKQFDDGRYELFKSTVKYDGDLGRQQHDFPSAAELPA
jgi:aryl-alcohol dehydrogenase-like predicted oxidoreductase